MLLEQERCPCVGSAALQWRDACGWDCHSWGAGGGLSLPEGWDWCREALPAAGVVQDCGRLCSKGRKVLWVWQGCGFGSVPIAFPLGEKHPSDCAIPFHHG